MGAAAMLGPLARFTVFGICCACCLSACVVGADVDDGGDAVPSPPVAITCPSPATPETLRVYEGLRPSCVGCHAEGERGFFQSAAAFQSLVVADPRYVVAGDADASELLRLLSGTGTGAFTQMPIAGPSYAQLVDEGAAFLTLAAVRDWIDGLGAQTRGSAPDPQAARATRMSAVQVQRALYQQLGLANDDFFVGAEQFGIEMAEAKDDELYPLLSADALPAPRDRATAERHQGFGGFSVVEQTRGENTPSSNFVNNLVQLSQRWCRLALDKPGNRALFPSDDARGRDDTDNVKATLRRWSRHFHATTLSDEQVDELYASLFLPLRADVDGDLTSAWAGTCSFFIRHPRWVFY